MQIGPYTVLEEVARGGQGVVYRARDAQGRAVALKLLLAYRAQNAHSRRRFETEVQALSRLHHPHVVSILGAGEHEGCPWLALDYVDGETLGERLRRGPLPIHEAIRVAQQLAQALSYVHACGVLHRDLKPDNALLRGRDALLTDFGLALDDQSSVSRITATGVFLGTPGYWAPEQARGETHAHGPALDVYGLGALLYACLTGRAPVQAASVGEYLRAIEVETPPPPRTLRPEVPRWLSELCMRCLALAPAARPTAEEVARSLLLAGGPVSVARGRGVAAWLLGAGALALAVGVYLAASSGPEGGPRASPNPGVAPATGASEPRPEDEASGPAPSPGDPSGAAEARRLTEEGMRKTEAGRNAEALEDYDRALQLDPENPLAYCNRGASKAGLGRHAEAIEDYDRALQLDPTIALAYCNRGVSKRSLGRHAEALEDFDRALELDPQDPNAYVNRGLSKADLGRDEDAIEDYDRALRLDPQDAGAYANRGVSNDHLGRKAEALEDFDRALRLDPQDAAAYANRGLCTAQLGRNAGAEERRVG
ncbi:MAG: tetratricopeptide repeat protein, partial [Planctomycetes bacterium]|nr:tetratricopeptide repeat protein [Planctomycetota bacterium]